MIEKEFKIYKDGKCIASGYASDIKRDESCEWCKIASIYSNKHFICCIEYDFIEFEGGND